MKKRLIVTIILAAMLLGWMTLIFLLSCEDGDKSGKTSTNIATEISEIIAPSKPAKETEKIVLDNQKTIRKSAHVLMYMVLGVLAAALTESALDASLKNKFMLSSTFSVFYAATDELHQFFVKGRSGLAEDLCLDAVAILASVAVTLAAFEIYKRAKAKKAYIS